MAKFQIMVFEIDDNSYGVDIKNINGIVKAKNYKIIPLPNYSEFIKGITNVRGKVYPVISMRKKFGFEEIPINSDTKFVLIKVADKELAIIVDEVTDILKLDDKDIISASYLNKDNEYIAFIVKLEEALVVGLNMVKIFDSQEILNIDIQGSLEEGV